jgi:hypothetical protein
MTGKTYYLCCAPTETTDDELIRVAGARRAVEECFQTARTEVGPNHYQVRRYDAWYRPHHPRHARAHLPDRNGGDRPKSLGCGPFRSRSARSSVSWHT